MESVECDVSDVSNIRWPSNLHTMNGGGNPSADSALVLPIVHTARYHRFPQRRQEKLHERQLLILLFLFLRLLHRRFPSPSFSSAATYAFSHHHKPRHCSQKLPTEEETKISNNVSNNEEFAASLSLSLRTLWFFFFFVFSLFGRG